jgi:hypothetical protein
MSAVDKLLEFFKKASVPERNQLMQEFLKEKAFYDVLHSAGLTIAVEDPQARGRIQPFGVASNILKINVVDELTLLKTLQLIQTIAKIQQINPQGSKNVVIDEISQITTIRDVQFSPKTLIVNNGFESDFVGWFAEDVGSIVIDTVAKHFGLKSVKMKATAIGNSVLSQTFPIPIKSDWVTEWAVYLQVEDLSVQPRIYCFYTDGTNDFDALVNTVAGVFQRRVFTPTSGKWIEKLTAYHSDQTFFSWFDDFETVF